jgi:hypothetical protein
VSTWVALEPLSATVEAGGEAVVLLRVRNTADVVEEYHIDVVGDPALWCAVEPTTLRLFPGTTGSVRLRFAPPRSPDAAAGPHPYGVRVRPVEAPDAVSVPEGNLSVIPFTSIHAELLPVTVRGWRHAKPRLVVDNYGNTTVTTAVMATARDNRVDFDLRTPSFQVPPGRAYFSVLTLRPERLLWLGRPVSHPFTTTVQPSGSEPAAVQGTYLQSALLPTWIARLGTVLAGLLAVFAALWFLAGPSVTSHAVAETGPAPAVSTSPQAQSSSPAPAASNPAAAGNTPGPATVSLPAPVSWWKLNDGSGTMAADTEGHNPATGTNIGWCATGNCATFNGTSSSFVTAGPVLNTGPGDSFTVAASVFMTSFPANGGFATVASQGAAHDSTFFLQYSGADQRWAFSRVATDAAAGPDTPFRALSDSPAVLDTWTYLTGVFNGSTGQMTLYVNGVAQNTVTDPTPFASSFHFVMGRAVFEGAFKDFFNGALSNVEAFQTALSPAQVQQLSSEMSS